MTSTFAVNSIYVRATAFLRMGATCVSDSNLSIATAISKYGVTHVRLHPGQLKEVLDTPPANFSKPRSLTLLLGAAPVPAALWQRALDLLATDISCNYSTNETGALALVDAQGCGTLRPGVEAQIVDDAGQVLPDGLPGEVRVRKPFMASGYLGHPDASARHFRDGWFYPGDAGVMPGPRQLRILGRTDDLLNIDGVKYSAAEYEAFVRTIAPVLDVGITVLHNAAGAAEVGIAIVLADRSSAKAVADQIARRLPPELKRVRIVRVDRIERTETGKLRRDVLRALFPAKA
jgi:acyl-CoA synthetase (AMP-forming)/AMP-acid ligase II